MSDLSNLPGKKLLEFLKSRQFRVRAVNLIYLVGASADDWSPIPNVMDGWNDVRIVVRNSGEVLGSWQATTDPGHHYTYNPMNPKGAAILALGQHQDAWCIGLHHGLPALAQCGDLVIYRDRTKDGGRYGHTMIAGAECGINHHGCNGKDGSANSVGRWSAGCQVGRFWKSHLNFMQMMRDSGMKRFDATLIDSKVFKEFEAA